MRGSIALVPAEAAAKHAPLMAFFPVLAYRRLAQEGLYVNRLLHVRNEEASYSAERDGHRLVHRVNAVTFTADAVWTLQRRGDWFATTSFDARFRNTTGVTCDLRLAIEPAILSATGQPLRLWPFGEVEALSAQQGSCQLEFTEYTIATAEVAWATTLCSTGLACAIPLAIAPAHWGVALARLDAFVQSHIHNPA
ncbi:MAG: hypothetical protein NW201_10770 [Gemmatimonadales bacterium]|nr:hypothetical protein [Gemmatimonadales bacterium]